MKIYISADIEGVCGVTHWDETELDRVDSQFAREQMTAEVAAACMGALDAGATELWVKDAHDQARNLIASRLPPEAKLIRGWSGHPFLMMQELNETFQATIMIGYHARVGSNSNPLAHTLSGNYTHVRLNDLPASEFLINAYTAALARVPVIFLSGDQGMCAEAQALLPGMETVAVKEGRGGSTVSIQPQLAAERIRAGVARSLKNEPSRFIPTLPENFQLELRYRRHVNAYHVSFFPGATLVDPHTVLFESNCYFEVLRFLSFAD